MPDLDLDENEDDESLSRHLAELLEATGGEYLGNLEEAEDGESEEPPSETISEGASVMAENEGAVEVKEHFDRFESFLPKELEAQRVQLEDRLLKEV